MSLPEFADTPTIRATIKHASAALKKNKVSQVMQKNGLERFGVTVSEDVMSDFLNKNTTPKAPDFLSAFWRFLQKDYPSVLEKAWEEALALELSVSGLLAIGIHNFLSPAKEFDAEKLNFLEGEYSAYRPFFLEDDKIMVSSMTCGVGGDLSKFQMKMAYSGTDGLDHDEIVEGFIIPYQQSVLFFGIIEETKAPFIFILVDFPVDGKTKKAFSGSGALLVGAGGTTPSGYPITIRRARTDVEIGVVTEAEFREKTPSPSLILSVLQRGITRWQPVEVKR